MSSATALSTDYGGAPSEAWHRGAHIILSTWKVGAVVPSFPMGKQAQKMSLASPEARRGLGWRSRNSDPPWTTPPASGSRFSLWCGGPLYPGRARPPAETSTPFPASQSPSGPQGASSGLTLPPQSSCRAWLPASLHGCLLGECEEVQPVGPWPVWLR